MSIFSEHLNELILAGNLTLPYLEKESGFSMALISKIKTGKRLPDCEDKMQRLIQSLHCTISEEETLLKEYRIEKMGRDKYLSMEESRKALEAVSHHPAPFLVNKKTEYIFQPRQAIHGKPNINMLVRQVIDSEAKLAYGCLKMIIQPDYTFLTDYLLGSLSETERTNLHLEHIVALYGSTVHSSNQKNMKIVGSCLQLCSIYGHNYEVDYHYKVDLTSDLFPFCILSSEYVILMSADYETALYSNEPSILEGLTQMFSELKNRCHSLLEIGSTPVDYLKSFENYISINEKNAHTLIEISYVPCILPNIPPAAAMKRMNPEMAKIPYVTEFLSAYWTMPPYKECITIFSLEGLELFMNSGICYELPKDSHSPFSMEERIAILQGFLKDCLSGRLIPIILKENKLNISPELFVSIYDGTEVHFLWNLQDTSFSSCVINENSIRNNLFDFLHYLLSTGDDTYTAEESLKLVEQFCNEKLHQNL